MHRIIKRTLMDHIITKLSGFHMGTNCCPFLAHVFFRSYQSDFWVEPFVTAGENLEAHYKIYSSYTDNPIVFNIRTFKAYAEVINTIAYFAIINLRMFSYQMEIVLVIIIS